MTKGFLKKAALLKRYGIANSTLFRWRTRNENPFPEPVVLVSGSHTRWAIEDIEKWEGNAI